MALTNDSSKNNIDDIAKSDGNKLLEQIKQTTANTGS